MSFIIWRFSVTEVGFDEIKKKVINPLKGKKIGAYYGCLLLRPGKIMAFDNPENPTIMEEFIRALGAEPVIYPYRNECCGGYISLKEKDMAQNMCEKIMDSAKGFEADMLITACPLCMYNLKKERKWRSPGLLFYRTSGRSSWSERGGGEVMAYTYGNAQNAAERIKEISGVNPLKCMKCGKCSATCPAFNEMDIKPHQFVTYVQNGRYRSTCTVQILVEMSFLLCLCRALPKRCKTRKTDRCCKTAGCP